MSITADRIHGEMRGLSAGVKHLDDDVQSYLVDALGSALDSLAVGVVIVADEARILHANQAARHMLDARSPIVSMGGCLGTLRADLTKELRRAIAAAQTDSSPIGAAGIGVPLIDQDMTAATAHVLPLGRRDLRTPRSDAPAAAAVFVAPASAAPPADIGTVARIFELTPAEVRLLQQLVAGVSLTEAAVALGIAEATARTHRNHIFAKTGVSRRADLLVLIGRLVPPIRCPN